MKLRGATAMLDEAALEGWGRSLGQTVARPVILCLEGPLGAGKSVLARAIARGAGVRGPIPSPSYGLLHEYPTPVGTLRHLDLYRLGSPAELWEIGWDTLGGPGDLVIVEWASRAGSLLPHERWEIRLTPVPGRSDLRHAVVRPFGSPSALPPLPGVPRL